jgi:hypothetical protein
LHDLVPYRQQLIAEPLARPLIGLLVLLEIAGNDGVDLGGEGQRRCLEEAIQGLGEVLRRPAS